MAHPSVVVQYYVSSIGVMGLSQRLAKRDAPVHDRLQVAGDISEYGGQHRPPDPKHGAPLYDLTLNDIYPDDVYSENGLRYYNTARGYDHEPYGIIMNVHNKPYANVTIYRAVPYTPTNEERIAQYEREKAYILKHGKLPPNVYTDKKKSQYYDWLVDELEGLKKSPEPTREYIKEINSGDWVTISKRYAKEHGESWLGGDYRIISARAKAKDLFTDGNSWFEYGYHLGSAPTPVMKSSASVSRVIFSYLKDNKDGMVTYLKSASFKSLYEAEGIKYVVTHWAKKYSKPLLVSIPKMDELWKRDTGFYVGEGQEGKTGARKSMERFISTGVPVEMPVVSVTSHRVSFTNGRHRFAVIRDMGKKTTWILVDEDQYHEAKDLIGSSSTISGEEKMRHIVQREIFPAYQRP